MRADGEPPAPHAHAGARAKQDIPPSLRRAVLQRDGHCCRVPGCHNAIFLDLHQIQLRSEGGQHEPENLITVCSAHHRALHRGQMHVAGNAVAAMFSHADGRRYGQLQAPCADLQTKVYSGLRGLGFRDSDVRRVMAELPCCASSSSIQHVSTASSRDHYSLSLLDQQELLVDDSLDQLARRFDATQFLRVHRSAIINLAQLRELVHEGDRRYVAVLADRAGTRVPVSRERLSALRAALEID